GPALLQGTLRRNEVARDQVERGCRRARDLERVFQVVAVVEELPCIALARATSGRVVASAAAAAAAGGGGGAGDCRRFDGHGAKWNENGREGRGMDEPGGCRRGRGSCGRRRV